MLAEAGAAPSRLLVASCSGPHCAILPRGRPCPLPRRSRHADPDTPIPTHRSQRTDPDTPIPTHRSQRTDPSSPVRLTTPHRRRHRPPSHVPRGRCARSHRGPKPTVVARGQGGKSWPAARMAAVQRAGLGAPASAPVRQRGSSGCKGSLRGIAPRTQAAPRCAGRGRQSSPAARIAAVHRTILGAPASARVWQRGSSGCKGSLRAPHAARPPGTPHHRRQPAAPPPCHVARGVIADLAIAPTPPAGPPTRTIGASPRLPPPCHVARGVIADLAIAPTPPAGPPTPHHRRRLAATTTVPRCKGCHRRPCDCTNPARRSATPHHRRQPAATATVPRCKECHRRPRDCTNPPACPTTRTTGAGLAPHHRLALHGVAARSPPPRQSRPPTEPVRPPPPSTLPCGPRPPPPVTARAVKARGPVRQKQIRGKGGGGADVHRRS